MPPTSFDNDSFTSLLLFCKGTTFDTDSSSNAHVITATGATIATVVDLWKISSPYSIQIDHQVDNAGQYDMNKSIVYVSGSNEPLTLASNPQIISSFHGDFLTIQG
jgi:hypothetical protein